ncbi:MAG: hypothetical protein M3Q30_03715 [Actinomycetota bacterium]|nr:hypothetical protein [Actinomycetota bacterium]
MTEQDVALTSRVRAVITDPARAAAAAFVVIEMAGFFFYLVAGHKIWFFRDDWDFLSGRSINAHDLLRQHGGHLVALPLVVFRGLYFFVGLRSYVPYQVLPIGLHLTAAALLRAIMRRAGVGPWISTVAASLFVFFGAGSQDILWAFQITFSGPLVLGLAQLLLADHDGPIDRRDWIGIFAGLAALMCSGVAVAMVAVVGLAALARRGWRVALFHTAPLGVLYAAWWLHYAGGSATVTNASVLIDWVRTGITGAFDALGQVAFVGWALAAMLVAGLVCEWRQFDSSERRRRGAVISAMLVGSVGFLLLSGINRAWIGTRFAASSRYLHIVVALLLPPLAVAANALIRRWRAVAPLVLVLLLIGLPGNVAATGKNFLGEGYFASYEQMVRSLPRMTLARRVPRDVRPELVNAPSMTVGWLLDGVRSGRIPAARASTPRERATNRLRLSLEELDEGTGSECFPVSQPVVRQLPAGESFVVRGTVEVRLIDDETGSVSIPVTLGATFFTGGRDHTLRNVAGGPITIRIAGAKGMLCGSSR